MAKQRQDTRGMKKADCSIESESIIHAQTRSIIEATCLDQLANATQITENLALLTYIYNHGD